MEFKNVLLSKEGSIAVIKMNRPGAFNAFDFDMLEGLIQALEVCSDDTEVKAVILTGEGKVFCSGGDLALSKQYLSDNTSLFKQLTKRLDRLIKELRSLPKPVIAVVNGAVGGGGLSIAAACDLRIAAASAKFRQAYTAVGLVPDGGWALTLPLLVGYAKAAEMVFLDPIIDASQAKDMGLVHQVADDEELMDVSMALAAKLANGPLVAFAFAKQSLNHALFGLIDKQLEFERACLLKTEKTADYAEGFSAFFDKRKPVFTGN